jgi:hypothetical protein
MGNYSWFVFSKTNTDRGSKVKVTANFNLFFNLNVIYPLNVAGSRNIENVKLAVYNALRSLSLLSGAIRITSVSDRYSDVYKGFNLSAVEDKYFMQPYGGLSIELDIYLRNNTCNV